MLKDVLEALDYESWWHEHDRTGWNAQWDWVQINDPDTELYFRLNTSFYPWYREEGI